MPQSINRPLKRRRLKHSLKGNSIKRCAEKELKRRMGWIGRRLRLFRAHGLIAKVSGTHRYVVTDKGRTTITALLAARKANVDQLTKLAA